jgi:hypothetical protein
MGESALIDKETGRIFWEGGATSTISASISPLLSDFGLHRAKSTILSIALVSCLLSLLVQQLRTSSSRLINGSGTEDSPLSWPLLVASILIKWTILKLPAFPTWFLLTVVTFYLLEAYYCNTRRYLANAMTTPDGVEAYLEQLRNEQPVVTWKVRCFHYEMRKWAAILLPQVLLRQWTTMGTDNDSPLSQSLLTKKILTHQAEANYTYKSCLDNTAIAGVWKRATAAPVDGMARFTKIKLSKLLVLSNKKARQDYFRQQAAFVTSNGQGDEYTEFSTNVALPGFQPKLLAVRRQPPKLFRLHMFWIFTLMGLTLPFRIWFSQRCDELRVTVAKETTANDYSSKKSTKTSSWLSFKSKSAQTEETSSSSSSLSLDPSFRKIMQQLSLYESSATGVDQDELLALPPPPPPPPSEDTAELMQELQDASEAAQALLTEEEADHSDSEEGSLEEDTSPINDDDADLTTDTPAPTDDTNASSPPPS